jgi:hypothetical protein
MEVTVPALSRTASIAGLVAVLSILTVEVAIPSVVTGGPPISGTLDRATIAAFYGHPGLEWALGLGLFALAIPAFLVFAVSIRELARDDPGARYSASIGVAFAVSAVPVYATKGAIGAALVAVVGSGLDPVPLFRFYDLVYNGAVYPLEAIYVLGLGLAIATVSGTRWVRTLTVVAATILFLNALVVFMGLPSVTAMPGNIAFAIWLAATSAVLWRLESFRAAAPVASPA